MLAPDQPVNHYATKPRNEFLSRVYVGGRWGKLRTLGRRNPLPAKSRAAYNRTTVRSSLLRRDHSTNDGYTNNIVCHRLETNHLIAYFLLHASVAKALGNNMRQRPNSSLRLNNQIMTLSQHGT